MATLKLKHFVLFIICFILLYYAQVPGGALLALIAWLQMCIPLWNKAFTIKNQIRFFLLFLTILPTLFIYGAVNSFVSVYGKESHVLFVFMYSMLSYCLSFLITLFLVFTYAFAKEDQTLLEMFSSTIASIKNNRFLIFYTSLIVFLTAIVPRILTEDYRIALGIILAHGFLRQSELKKLFRGR